MQNINININLNNLGAWMDILVARVQRITLVEIPLIILALALPPVAVLIKVGFTAQFWINVVLTMLGYVPGQVHALWIVLFL